MHLLNLKYWKSLDQISILKFCKNNINIINIIMYVMYKYNINIMNRNKFVSNLIIFYWELTLRLFN